MKQNYVTMTKTIDDNNVKHTSLLILKISFLTLFGCGVKITPDIKPIYACTNIIIPKTNISHRQTNRDYKGFFAMPFL